MRNTGVTKSFPRGKNANIHLAQKLITCTPLRRKLQFGGLCLTYLLGLTSISEYMYNITIIYTHSAMLWLEFLFTEVLSCNKGNEFKQQLGSVGMVSLRLTVSGFLSCAQGQTLLLLLSAEWLNGPSDQICQLRWAPITLTKETSWEIRVLTVGALTDPELQWCSEKSDPLRKCPYHAALSALSECAYSCNCCSYKAFVNTVTLSLGVTAGRSTECKCVDYWLWSTLF